MTSVEGDDYVIEHHSADKAFELVAHETRLRTLRILNDAEAPLAFGELRERVGVDDPGGFNYHLRRLTGWFVRSVDGPDVVGGAPGRDDDGYELTPAGRRVVGTVLSGGYTKELAGDNVETDTDCLECGASIEMRFRTYGVSITCPDCSQDYTHARITPSILEGRSKEDAAAVINRCLMRNHACAWYGFCYSCEGPMDVSVEVAHPDDADGAASGSESDADGTDDDRRGPSVGAIFECQLCGIDWQSSLPPALLSNPVVVAFHQEQGIDLREAQPWELDWLGSDITTVTSQDPLRVEVSMTVNGTTLVVVVDSSMEIVEQRRP